ncbi:hypothetical protein ACWA7J_13950 [Leptothrix sp. BB-4]
MHKPMHKQDLTLDGLFRDRDELSTPAHPAKPANPAMPTLQELLSTTRPADPGLPSHDAARDRAERDGDQADNHSPEWMAAIGRIGGQSRSAAKSKAARLNGLKGGRPRKPDTFVPGDQANVLVHITAGSTLVLPSPPSKPPSTPNTSDR